MPPLTVSVTPSLPAANLDELLALGRALAGVAPELQVDLVDGEFAPARSWPFTDAADPVASLASLAPLAAAFALEFDCMLCSPERYLDAFAALGAARVVVHHGSTEQLGACATHARAHGYRLGLGVTNDVPLATIEQHLQHVSYVQLMGIAVVGAQGQPFDARTIPRAAELRALYPMLEIAVDGSVNAETIPHLRAAGVNRFAPGSAIARAADPAAAYRALAALARN